MDGAFYALGPLVAFCTVLFLIAEPMRNTGKYTLGDVIRSRMQTRTSLLAAIAGTVVVNFAYLMPQMAGAGVLVRLLTGISYDWAVIFVGISMIVYVAFGGMLATTWVQIVKAVLMLARRRDHPGDDPVAGAFQSADAVRRGRSRNIRPNICCPATT